MRQIADWLKKLGMSEYAERFAENRLDFSVLRDLTDQDLKDLGVVLGDRRKMLRAIRRNSGHGRRPHRMTFMTMTGHVNCNLTCQNLKDRVICASHADDIPINCRCDVGTSRRGK